MPDWIKRIFGRRIHLTCPWCHADIQLPRDDVTCPDCKMAIPREYIDGHAAFPSLFVPIIGFPHASKSVWLDCLATVTANINHIWEGCLETPLSEFTDNWQRAGLANKENRTLPPKTPDDTSAYADNAVLLQLTRPARWQGRTLIFRDVPGEAFLSFSMRTDLQHFVARSSTAFIFADFAYGAVDGVPNENKTTGNRVDRLAKQYIRTLTEQGKKPTRRDGRSIVVVVPKVDRLRNQLPQELLHYVDTDPLLPVTQGSATRAIHDSRKMAEYMEILNRVGKGVRDWFVQQPGGSLFCDHAEQNHITLRFSLINCIPSGVELGKDANDRTVYKPIGLLEPRRVLDPLFLALELNSA